MADEAVISSMCSGVAFPISRYAESSETFSEVCADTVVADAIDNVRIANNMRMCRVILLNVYLSVRVRRYLTPRFLKRAIRARAKSSSVAMDARSIRLLLRASVMAC